MSTLSLRLPESLHKEVKVLAGREGVSINQLIASAVAEKMSALMTEEYLQERAKKGSHGAFTEVMGRVPDVNPEPHDQL